MSPFVAVVLVGIVMFAVMACLWVVQRRLLEADVVDMGWTAGLGGAALFYALAMPDGLPARRWLVALMAAIWAGRLAVYLLVKRVLVSGEDGRYEDLRKKWGPAAQARFFIFFQAQGLLVALLSVHFLIAMLAPAPSLRLLDGLGMLVWLGSIVGESLADRQLSRFREDPANRGRVCRVGLWKYSRHPNYFFEWLHWLAYIPIAIGSPLLPLMVVAPALMLTVMLFVTGIPPIEKRAVLSRGEEYRRYQRTTSAFFPWFPSEEA